MPCMSYFQLWSKFVFWVKLLTLSPIVISLKKTNFLNCGIVSIKHWNFLPFYIVLIHSFHIGIYLLFVWKYIFFNIFFTLWNAFCKWWNGKGTETLSCLDHWTLGKWQLTAMCEHKHWELFITSDVYCSLLNAFNLIWRE